MSWRVAKAIEQLFKELNAACPGRSKASDGTIGDAAHAARTSDHNPWVQYQGMGIVTAGDFTLDLAHGADMPKLVRYFTQVSHDKRIKYLIHAGRIYSSYPTSSAPAWAARAYGGPNPHNHHLHVSVNPEPYYFDDNRVWGVMAALHPTAPPPTTPPGHVPVPNVGSHPVFPLPNGYYFGPRLPLSNVRSVSGYYNHTEDLKRFQRQMRVVRGWSAMKVTGHYDDSNCKDVVTAFQKEKKLAVDGLVGKQTWDAAWTSPIT